MRLYVEGYDKITELIAEDVDVTEIGFETAAEILGVEVDDLVNGHPLNDEQLSAIGRLVNMKLDPASQDYFLAGRAD